MRILVTSDSHGRTDNLKRAILAQPTADIVINLGDGERDVELVKASFPEKMFLTVRGNCDFGSELPASGEYTVSGILPEDVKIFYVHGHTYGVKSGLYSLISAARGRNAKVLLYGHTHVDFEDYRDGLYIMNPGALSSFIPTYGTLDITEQGIVTNILRLP